MKEVIAGIFRHENLERSVLIGYYGGGNYGDELLLEVLMNLFARRGIESLTVTYQHMERFHTYHHEFGYDKVNMASKWALLRAVIKNKNIVIGGGGLWGLDVNPNIFLLSLLLFVSRMLLRKRVYLLGVGYYGSTSELGHTSAWLAGKSAYRIVARDAETFQNFGDISERVVLGTDIALSLQNMNLTAYHQDSAAFLIAYPVRQKTLFIALRRFRQHQKNEYAHAVETCIAKNHDVEIIVALMEPRAVDPEGYELIRSWQKRHKHVRVMDFSYNPVLLYMFFRTHQKQLALIAPQFHVILVAHIAGVSFLPVVYDNKVAQLLDRISKAEPIDIKDLDPEKLQTFIDDFKEA